MSIVQSQCSGLLCSQVRAVNLGTMSSAVWCAFAYLYMASSW